MRHALPCHTRGAKQVLARNLNLLRAIEKTLDVLAADTQMFEAVCCTYDEVRDHVKGVEGRIDDANGSMQKKLEEAAEICAAIYEDAKKRHASACSDHRLRDDDGVADAYAEYMNAVADTHDTVELLREDIATHDALLEPSTSKAYTDVDDLIAALMD